MKSLSKKLHLAGKYHSRRENKGDYNQVTKRSGFIGIFENFTRSYPVIILFLTMTSVSPAFSQEFVRKEVVPDNPANNLKPTAEKKISDESLSVTDDRPNQMDFRSIDLMKKDTQTDFSPEEEFRKFLNEKKRSLPESAKIFSKDEKELTEPTDEAQIEGREKFHWKPAIAQSLNFLSVQHGFRLMQKKTQRELGGPFIRDWGRSIKALRGWEDGDNFVINYVGHPLQGGVTGRIFISNSDRARQQEFGKSKEYWKSRFKAMLWSTIWSTQFEMGPLSEATLGNVGIRKKNGYSEMAYVDLVITPTVGTGVVIGEDAIDKYLLKNWLERKSGKLSTKIKILRSILTPTTAFTNLMNGKAPWKRYDR